MKNDKERIEQVFKKRPNGGTYFFPLLKDDVQWTITGSTSSLKPAPVKTNS